jgi:hypothetical protein
MYTVNLIRFFSLAIAAAVSLFSATPPAISMGERVSRYFSVQPVSTPNGIDAQVGGLSAAGSDRLVVAFHHGQIAFLDLNNRQWTLFGEGLHEPLGVLVERDGSVLVMQRPELTRLRDTRGNGKADYYETVWDNFGLSGNYHEFAFGPIRSANGDVIVGLNLASNDKSIFRELRGAWSEAGLPRERFYTEPWEGETARAAGRMFARVSWRGWVISINPQTGVATPLASGFRSPDGLGCDEEGNLFVSDNQGDWRGTSEVHVVVPGGFHGHPASLVWRPDWDGSDPSLLPIERLERLRTLPAIQIPHLTYANSPTQMVPIPKTEAWGPFGGQLVIGEMNAPRLLRLLPEKVDGVWQGACAMFIETGALKLGLHRLAFVGDTLYIGRIHLGWSGSEGIVAVRPTNRVPFDVLSMRVADKGFKMEFTSPLGDGATNPSRWRFERYRYRYHAAYGSPKLDLEALCPTHVELSADKRIATLTLGVLQPGFLYDADVREVASDAGELPLNGRIVYTLHRLLRH